MNAQIRPGTLAKSKAPTQEADSAPIRMYRARPFEMEAFGKLSEAAIAAHLELYQGYVTQTNAVLEATAEMEKADAAVVQGAARPIEALARRLSFELNGITLHELFFEQYLKAAGTETGSFERVACHNFGTAAQWRSHIISLARTRGAGWVISVLDDARGFVHNVWVDLHHLYVPAGHRPIFVLDLWEHAYLSDYGSKGRDEYVDAAVQAASKACLDARVDRAQT